MLASSLFCGARHALPAALCATIIVAFFCAVIAADLTLYEDAFFYLRYADNLAAGYGLVYNPGERYESNTNFLWSILLVPAFWLGADPELYVKACGALVSALTLWLVYLLAAAVADKKTGIMAIVPLATHWTFFLFAGTGFAPALPAMFALAALLCARRYAQNGQTRDAALGGAALALMGMTRLDAALLGAITGLYVLDALRRAARRDKFRPAHAALFILMPALLYGGYLLGKYLYYGDVFPATYYAKAAVEFEDFKFFDRGARYLYLYAASYWLLWLFPLFAHAFYRLFKDRVLALPRASGNSGELDDARRLTLTLLALTALWFGYTLKIGGGYSEFRFMATSAPFLFLAIALLLRAYSGYFRALIVTILIGASVWHGATYGSKYYMHAEEGDPKPYFIDFDYFPVVRYQIEAGRKLREIAGATGDYPDFPRVASRIGGRIPFYSSRLYVLEMQGWANARLFDAGNHYPTPDIKEAGHQHIASAKFMRDLNIHLVVLGGLPLGMRDLDLANADVSEKIKLLFYTTIRSDLRRDLSAGRKLTDLGYPPDMLLFAIPLPSGDIMYGLYFTRDARLDARLTEMQKAGDVVIVDLAELY